MTGATDALAVAIDAENAAIFVYGVAVAYAASSRRDTVTDYTAEHRSRRDELERLVVTAKGAAPVPAAGYVTPVTVADPVTAIQAVLAVEQDCARAYRALLERADTQPQRRSAVDALSDCARRAAGWRLILRISPATTALPGTQG